MTAAPKMTHKLPQFANYMTQRVDLTSKTSHIWTQHNLYANYVLYTSAIDVVWYIKDQTRRLAAHSLHITQLTRVCRQTHSKQRGI